MRAILSKGTEVDLWETPGTVPQLKGTGVDLWKTPGTVP